jgi:hypothetical protein
VTTYDTQSRYTRCWLSKIHPMNLKERHSLVGCRSRFERCKWPMKKDTTNSLTDLCLISSYNMTFARCIECGCAFGSRIRCWSWQLSNELIDCFFATLIDDTTEEKYKNLYHFLRCYSCITGMNYEF